MGNKRILLALMLMRIKPFFSQRKVAIILSLVLILSSISIVSCSKKARKSQQPQTRIIEAAIQESNSSLYYSASIQPLRTVNVISPIDGVIQVTHFHYGNLVTTGQLLMEINSTKSKQDYVTALTTYVKDKDQFLRSQHSFEATTALYQAGIVDKESYLNEKAQLNANQIAYINSLENLKQITHEFSAGNQRIEALTLENVDAIQQLIQQQLGTIKLYAPSSGIALASAKNANEAKGTEQTAAQAEVKQDQTIFAIGDMTGLSAVINVSEMDIDRLKPKQTVLISVTALPGLILPGSINNISQQAKNAEGVNSSTLATFPVEIIVPTLTDVQRKFLRIGMTAKVNITLHNPPQIKLPIQAVFNKDDTSMVSRINPKTGKATNVPVETGETDLTQVVILKGLRPGDKVLVHD